MPDEVSLELVSAEIFEKTKRKGNLKDMPISGMDKEHGLHN
jgi:hypothetical protein